MHRSEGNHVYRSRLDPNLMLTGIYSSGPPTNV